MNDDQRKWVFDAMQACKEAKEKGLSVWLFRRFTDEPDIVVTTASDTHLAQVLQSHYAEVDCAE